MAPTTIEETLQAAGKIVHLGDGPTIPLRVRLGILLASLQGRDTPPRKKIRLLDDSSADGRFTAAAAGPSVSWRRDTCPAYLKFVRPLISPRGVTLLPPSPDA